MTRQQQLQNQLQAQKSKESSVEDLKKLYPFFKTSENEYPYCGKLASKNIRVILKRIYPSIKFSVRNRHIGCIYITWTDGVNIENLKNLIKYFDMGTGKDKECSCKDILLFNELFGGVQHLFFERNYSDTFIQQAIDLVFMSHKIFFKNNKKPTVTEYINGMLCVELNMQIYKIMKKLNDIKA